MMQTYHYSQDTKPSLGPLDPYRRPENYRLDKDARIAALELGGAREKLKQGKVVHFDPYALLIEPASSIFYALFWHTPFLSSLRALATLLPPVITVPAARHSRSAGGLTPFVVVEGTKDMDPSFGFRFTLVARNIVTRDATYIWSFKDAFAFLSTLQFAPGNQDLVLGRPGDDQLLKQAMNEVLKSRGLRRHARKYEGVKAENACMFAWLVQDWIAGRVLAQFHPDARERSAPSPAVLRSDNGA